MEPVLVLVGLFFLAAWLLLLRSKHERFGNIVFMIRSSLGVKLIDSIAKSYPRMWTFLADFSVLLSFGGIGGYYLSAHKESRGNLYTSLILIGFLFAATGAYLGRFELAAAFLALGILLSYVMRRLQHTMLDTGMTTLLFFLATSMILGATSAPSALNAAASALCGLFGLPAIMVYVLSSHGLSILASQTNVPGVSPMLPAAQGGDIGVTFPGYDLFIPWQYVLGALFITLVVHEGAHGVLIRVAKIKLKSTGLLSLFSFPVGAFAEPDEEELNRCSSVERMRIFTVGSFANLITGALAAILIVLLVNVSAGYVYSNGMQVVGFIPGYPAEKVLPQDTVVYSIDGKPTTNLTAFKAATASMPPGEVITLDTSKGSYELKLAANPEDQGKGYVGVYLKENPMLGGLLGELFGIGALVFMLEMLEWIAFFNLNIALVNIMPLIPFDGGRMFKEVISTMRMSELNVKRVLYATIAFMAVLFIVNMLPLLRMMLDYAIKIA
ncbi:MAG: site-2 protease family protein [Candidatus Altiarchaeota archaeon]